MKGEVQVRDLSAAAALIAWGHPIIDVTGHDFKVFTFDAAAEADLQGFYSNAPIPARDFARAIKKVRGIIHDNRDNR